MPVISDLMNAALERLESTTSFTADFTVSKNWMPIQQVEDIDDIVAFVVGGPEVWEKEDRGGTYTVNYDVIVVVQARVDSSTDLDTCVGLVEEIKTDFAGAKRLAGKPLLEIEQETPFDPDMLYTSQVFFTTITFRYRGFK